MKDASELKTPEEILKVALAKETQARDFYAGMAAHCTVDFVKELLERLRDEEFRHMRLVQAMVTKLSLGKNAV